jgi:Eukaryotic cytochrome b561
MCSHPLFMSIAFASMSLGVVAYRNKLLLEIFSPIMQHGSTTKNRTIHMTLQTLTGGFAVLGLTFIVANKLKAKHSATTLIPHTVHSICGTLVLLVISAQIIVGSKKHASLTTGVIDARNSTKKYRWHGKLGMLLYDTALVTVVTGLWELYGISVGSVIILTVLGMLWLNINYQMHESQHIYRPGQLLYQIDS